MSGPQPVAPRRSCPRTRPGGYKWTGETDREAGIGHASGPGIAEVALDQRTHAEALVEFAREQEAGIGRDRGATELDAKLGIEREANRARFGFTHWMMPSAPARHPRNPHFLRALSDYGAVGSLLKTKMRVKKGFHVFHFNVRCRL